MRRVFVCVLALAATALVGRPLAAQSSAARPDTAVRFTDEAGLLTPDLHLRFDSFLRSISAESGVDIRFLVVRGVPVLWRPVGVGCERELADADAVLGNTAVFEDAHAGWPKLDHIAVNGSEY